MAYGVLGQGLLSRAVTGPLPPGDSRAGFPRSQPGNLARKLEKAAVLKAMTTEKGCTAAQLAIAWVLSRGGHKVPIVGMSSRSHLAVGLPAADITFAGPEAAELDRAFAPGSFAGDLHPPLVTDLPRGSCPCQPPPPGPVHPRQHPRREDHRAVPVHPAGRTPAIGHHLDTGPADPGGLRTCHRRRPLLRTYSVWDHHDDWIDLQCLVHGDTPGSAWARYTHNDRLIDALMTQAFCSPEARACYDRQRARGAGRNAALRQLASILYGCLKTRTPTTRRPPGRSTQRSPRRPLSFPFKLLGFGMRVPSLMGRRSGGLLVRRRSVPRPSGGWSRAAAGRTP